jgi:glycogen operon protein
VSHDAKHNEANGEGNRDGTDDNLSWNCGAEGETSDPRVLDLRRRLAKNHLCALLFSCGTPMLLGGDEFLRSQGGNNNAYCQDNATSWFDWERAAANAEMVAFTRKAIAFARAHPILQRRKFFAGQDLDADSVPDITWYGPDGGRAAWDDFEARTLCYRLDGGEAGPGLGKYFLFFVLHADHHLEAVRVPPLPPGYRWHRVVDTSLPPGEDFADPGLEVPLDPADAYLVNPRSTVVLLGK